MKLFMIGFGGSLKGANIEVHDIQFAIAKDYLDAINLCKESWYGDSLHLDSYTEIEFIDGYKLDFDLKSNMDLFFITYGGYKDGVIDEIHEYAIIPALSEKEAKKEAKARFHSFRNIDHVDNVVNISELLNTKIGYKKGDFKFADNVTNYKFIKFY